MSTKLKISPKSLGGAPFYLDADQDTYLDPSVDDVVDVYVGGSLDWSFSANLIDLKDGTILEINEYIRFDTDTVISASVASIGRVASDLHYNVATGELHSFRVNDVEAMRVDGSNVVFTQFPLTDEVVSTGSFTLRSGSNIFMKTGGTTRVEVIGNRFEGGVDNTTALGKDTLRWLNLFIGSGEVDLESAIRWNAGASVTAGDYSIQRNADGTNRLQFNVPTGASHEWSINDVAEILYSTGAIAFQQATTISTTTGNLTIAAAAGADVLIGDDVVLITTDGGALGGAGAISFGTTPISAEVFFELANPTYTVTAGANGIVANINPALTEAGSGTHTIMVGFNIGALLLTGGAGATTIAATVRIGGAPTGATTNLAFWVDAGASRFDDDIIALTGVRVGADSGDNEIDDATQGSASTTLYIGNASITVSSDMRVKSDMLAWEGNALSIINSIPVKDYYYNSHVPHGGVYDGKYVGIIAQDVYKVIPWAVNTQGGANCRECKVGLNCETHTQPWSVRAELLMGVVVKSIQELGEEIEVLKEQVLSLGGRPLV